MRAVSTCPAGVMGWSLGAPTQPSARTTQGSYFNRHGVLKFAPPGVLRPNYVYKNGIWVQDGWLREGASTNLLSGVMPDPNDKTHETLPEGNEYEIIAGSEVVQWSPTAAAQTLDFCLFTTPAYTTTQSFFIKSLSGAVGITLIRPWYWGPSITVNTGTGGISGASTMFVEDCGNGWWRMGGDRCVANQVATWTRLQVDAPAVVLISCNMLEAASAPISGTWYATSWIPYGQTRTSD